MIKHLISGGCSFSADIDCWPVHLAEQLNITHDQTGVGSSGNDLISRKVIRQVYDCLQAGMSPEEMYVGVMWSGPGRKAFYVESAATLKLCKPYISDTSPHVWPEGSNPHGWVLINPFFDNKFAMGYYRTYNNSIQDQIETYEHMLRLQLFLQSYNIKYFFSTYTDEVLKDPKDSAVFVDHLKDLIDWNRFLPVKSMHSWCVKNYPDSFLRNDDPHPGNFQHKQFAAEVIRPWLEQRNA